MIWAGHETHIRVMRSAYSTLIGNPGRKKSLGRPRHRWEDNIKMDLREIGWEGGDWMHMAEDMEQWQALY
jgi:hypothetical protein